jgi:putative hydrolase of the HAD superfamily
MTKQSSIKGLLVDVGGVLLSNTWDTSLREKAAEVFKYDFEEADLRHHDIVDDYERGLLSLDEYLTYVVFYKKRPFSIEQFKEYMMAQSSALPKMREYLAELKTNLGLQIIMVSNDAREVTEYRVRKFNLINLFDIFVCSCFVGVRKPSARIYRLALDLAQLAPQDVLYIEDRDSSVEAAAALGIRGIQHKSYENTKKFLEEFGLSIENMQEQHV